MDTKAPARRNHVAAIVGLAATCALFGPFLAAAAPSQAPDTRALTPRQRVEVLADWTRREHAARVAAGATLDSQPPSLDRFTIEGDVDAQSPLPAALANLAITDDLSGLQTWIVTLVGPSGQMVQRVEGVSTGQRRLEGRVSIGAAPVATVPFSRYSEPGTWTVDSVFISDAAYNARFYGREELAAMGRSSFNVTNKAGFDKTGPRLLGGVIESKRVSLSTPPPGTWEGTLPVMSAALRTVDDGNGAIAGPAEAIAAFCLADRYHDCVDRFELQGHANEFGRRSATLRLGGQPRADQTPGRYLLQYVVLNDQARNMTVLTTHLLGGETDFSQLFPTTAITIEP
jgi:hypothetical protein